MFLKEICICFCLWLLRYICKLYFVTLSIGAPPIKCAIIPTSLNSAVDIAMSYKQDGMGKIQKRMFFSPRVQIGSEA
jgi:hypothetical protein